MGEGEKVEYQWAYSIMDSSRVSTFLISMLLIVYGSFRSLNMEQQQQQEEQKISGVNCLLNPDGAAGNNSGGNSNVQTLDAMQALCLPLGASISLLVMFFFFDSMQMLFAICTAIIATVALAFLLLPMCQYIIQFSSSSKNTNTHKISFGVCGRFTLPEIFSFLLSLTIVFIWILTGHWLLMDAMGMGLCVAFIAFVRLPSLKVSTLLLTGLLIYDVFWVFFSSYLFNGTNVMVKVATRPAENPIRKLNIGGAVEKLSLPGKLVFPSFRNGIMGAVVGPNSGGTGGGGAANQQQHFSMLGLGDIVMPGLLLCFVLRYDKKKQDGATAAAVAAAALNGGGGCVSNVAPTKLTYFKCSLLGYFLGLLTATVSSEVFKAAQPALLYLVPFTLLPLLCMAYLKGDLRRMWSEPFSNTYDNKKSLNVHHFQQQEV